MAKRCSVCNKTFPDELNYCPQCGAWTESPAKPPAKGETPIISEGDFVVDPTKSTLGVPPGGKRPIQVSSGEFMVDPLKPDSGSDPKLGIPPGGAPIRIPSEEIQVDPMKPDPPSDPKLGPVNVPSSEDVIEIDWEEVGAPDAPAPKPPPQAPPIVAGWQAGRPAADITPAPKSSSGDFELPPSAGDELIPVDSSRPTPEDINIDELIADEGGSEVRLATRSGEAPAWEPEEAMATMPDSDARAGGSRLEEPSAVNLAALAGEEGDSSEIETARTPRQPPVKPRGGAGGWVGGGLIGAGLATAACLGIWFSGALEPKRPAEQPSAPADAGAGPERIGMPADAGAQAAIDQLQAEKKKLDEQLAAALKDLDAAKQGQPDAAAVQAALDKQMKENQALADAKKKAEAAMADVRRLLTEAKFVSDQQPSTEAGLANLLKELDGVKTDLAAAKKAAPVDNAAQMALDNLKKENASLAEAKQKADSVLSALQAKLKEYVSETQPDVAKAIDKLVADKQAAVKELAVATDKLNRIDAGTKDAAARIKEAEDAKKELIAQLDRSRQAAADATEKMRGLEDKAQELTAQFKTVNDWMQEIRQVLVNSRLIASDARGPAIVRSVEQLVASAATPVAPRNGASTPRNGAAPRPADPATPSDPMAAEKHYVRGLTNFWATRYWASENDFLDAVRTAGTSNPDARYYYFLGLSQLAQGKTDEARQMFKQAGHLEEQRKPSSAVVSQALERVQGRYRRIVEDYRP